MASACAVPQLIDRVELGRRRRVFLVRVRFEPRGMAGGTIGYEVRPDEGDLFIVLLVAARTRRRVAAVVFVSSGDMGVGQDGGPGRGSVANLAGLPRDEVLRSLALCGWVHTIVTSLAGTGDLRMVEDDTRPICRHVAAVAGICRGKVASAPAHRRGVASIMTAHTGTQGLGVVKRDGRPIGGHMASGAIIRRLEMGLALALGGCVLSVMAGEAG